MFFKAVLYADEEKEERQNLRTGVWKQVKEHAVGLPDTLASGSSM